jgi:hypothetical protein
LPVVAKADVARAVWEKCGDYKTPLYNRRPYYNEHLRSIGITPDLLDEEGGQDDE